MLMERSMSRPYLIVFQLLLAVSLAAAYYLHPSHLLKRKLGLCMNVCQFQVTVMFASFTVIIIVVIVDDHYKTTAPHTR